MTHGCVIEKVRPKLKSRVAKLYAKVSNLKSPLHGCLILIYLFYTYRKKNKQMTANEDNLPLFAKEI